MDVGRLGLAVARLAAAGWVGAATLFVVTAVREVTFAGFDAATKDQLALLRFPAYYVCGFAVVGIAFVAALTASMGLRPRPKKVVVAAGLLLVTLLLMAGDFVAVYQPIADMITPPGRVHVAQFRDYHRASVWINVGHVGLCAVAAVLLCWPDSRMGLGGGRRGVAEGPVVE
jgi:hypothetical protein